VYPPVRQLDSHDLYRTRAAPRRDADALRGRRGRLIATAVLVVGVVAAALAFAVSSG